MCSFLEFLPFRLLHLWPPASCQKCQLRVPTSFWLQQLLPQVIRSCLCFSGFACLFRFWVLCLPRQLISLTGPRKDIDIQCFEVVLVVRLGVMTSNLFIYQSLMKVLDSSSQFHPVSVFIFAVHLLQIAHSWILILYLSRQSVPCNC